MLEVTCIDIITMPTSRTSVYFLRHTDISTIKALQPFKDKDIYFPKKYRSAYIFTPQIIAKYQLHAQGLI